MRITTLLIILASALIFPALRSAGQVRQDRKETPPNIIFILADDLGYGDLGSFGSKEIETPRLDKLAKGGLKLTNFYAGGPLCTPSRAAFLTGVFPFRFGIDNAFGDVKGQYLQTGVPTVPLQLRAAGYFTAHVGKWHLGGVREEDFLERQQGKRADPGPMQHGYQYYLSNIEDKQHRGILYHGDSLYKSAGRHMVRNDSFAAPVDKWWDEIKVDETIHLIRRHSGKSPFFISLNLFTPHVPYEPVPGEELSHYLRKGATGYDLLYRSMISYMDRQIGRIVDALEAEGVLENTIIIFTSDNGPYVLGSNGGYRGRKTDLHEGGIRVPAIIHWPRKVKAGSESGTPVQMVDILPTLCEIANAPLPQTIDGQSFAPLLTGKQELQRKKPLIWYQPFVSTYPANIPGKFDSVYSGSTKLNRVLTPTEKPQPYSTWAILWNGYKLYADGDKAVELFHLPSDPFENNNVVATQQEVQKNLLKMLLAETKSAPLKKR